MIKHRNKKVTSLISTHTLFLKSNVKPFYEIRVLNNYILFYVAFTKEIYSTFIQLKKIRSEKYEWQS